MGVLTGGTKMHIPADIESISIYADCRFTCHRSNNLPTVCIGSNLHQYAAFPQADELHNFCNQMTTLSFPARIDACDSGHESHDIESEARNRTKNGGTPLKAIRTARYVPFKGGDSHSKYGGRMKSLHMTSFSRRSVRVSPLRERHVFHSTRSFYWCGFIFCSIPCMTYETFVNFVSFQVVSKILLLCA